MVSQLQKLTRNQYLVIDSVCMNIRYKKELRLLRERKHRKESGLFVVEDEKSVTEVLHSDFEIVYLASSKAFFEKHKDIISSRVALHDVIDEEELKNISSLTHNEDAVAIVRQKQTTHPKDEDSIVLVLDTIQDPGNLGTIIRTADWYGITTILTNPETADFYNSKTIQATKGSFTRVNVVVTDIELFLKNTTKTIYGAYLEGTNIHEKKFDSHAVLIIGNEAHGISDALSRYVTEKITIPRYGKAESLNAAIATGILLDALKRSS